MHNSGEQERTFSFVVINTGVEQGYMVMHDSDFSESAVRATFAAQMGVRAEIIATLNGLSSDESAVMQVIFNNVDEISIQSQQELQSLLRFSFIEMQTKQVRRAVLDTVSKYMQEIEFLAYLPIMLRVFELYVKFGNNAESFEEEAMKATSKMNDEKRRTCISIFHIILRKLQPQIARDIQEAN